jgi:hypothetical protein
MMKQEGDVMEQAEVIPAPNARQVEIFFRPESYSAFPHLVKLDGDELLLAFREAPRVAGLQHTHPRSLITLIRSYDGGKTWDIPNGSQMGAGGGQEFCLLNFGGGHVGGALAWHEVVPVGEAARTGVPHRHKNEFPFRTPGACWAWSGTYGLTWPPQQISVMGGMGAMPCGSPVLTRDGLLLCPVYDFSQTAWNSVLCRSLDQGRSWLEPVVMARGVPGIVSFCEPALAEIAPNILVALHRVENAREGGGCFWSNRSDDGGLTWSKPVNTGIRSGACPRLLKLADGRLLLTFGRRFAPCGIRALLSRDGGETWGKTAYELRPAKNGNQGYTRSVELSPGRILTVSYAENEAGVTGIVGTFWDLPA